MRRYGSKVALDSPASFQGWQRLGQLYVPANAASVGPITIPAKDLLRLEYLIAGTSAADIPAFVFNGDTTAANYGSYFITQSNAATPSNARSASNAGSIGMIPVSGTSIALGRRGHLLISNRTAGRKVINIENANESSTSTGPVMDRGWGEWLNTSAQITQVTLRLTGANNLLAGSFAIIYGDDVF